MRPSNASDAGHGHNPIHGAPAAKLDLSFDPNERKGLTTAQAEELQRTGGQYGLITMCIGGGQGIAMVIERV
jgi:hypothetical protein